MGAVDLVTALIEKRKEAEKEKRRIEESNKKWWEKKKEELEAHAEKILSDFDGKFGLQRVGNQLVKEQVLIATITIEWCYWEFQGSDESPVEKMEGYNIVGKVHDCKCTAETTEHFDKYFANLISKYL